MPVFASAITNPSYVLLEIDWPDQTRRYSKVGVNSASVGAFIPRVVRFGQVRYSLADENKSLQHSSMSITLADPDQTLANMIGCGARWSNAAARVYVAPAAASSRSQWTQFFGGVVDEMQPTDAGQWVLTLTPQMRRLRAPIPLSQINLYDFTNPDKSAQGIQYPLMLGKADDFGDQNTGACPAIYVDKTNFIYL